MKRGSVIGPLILIGIGALFLLRNLWPDIPMADIISKPIPRNGISGGEWVLVLLICIIGGTMYTARHFSSWLPNGPRWRNVMVEMGENYDYTFTPAEKPCAKGCRVLIENFRGNAKIMGSKDATGVSASGRESIRSFQQTEADKANKETPLEL